MTTRNRRLPLLNGFFGAMLLIRGITHLWDAMPTLMPSGSATAAAYGYAFGQALAISLMLAAGAGLLTLVARQHPAAREKQTRRSKSGL